MSGNRSKIRFAPFGFAKFQCISIDGCAALRAQSPRHICTLLRATALLLTSFFAVKPAEFSVILLQRQVEKVIEDRLNRILSIAIERNALNAEICISCISYYKCHEHLSRTRPSGIYAVNLPLSPTLIRKKTVASSEFVADADLRESLRHLMCPRTCKGQMPAVWYKIPWIRVDGAHIAHRQGRAL